MKTVTIAALVIGAFALMSFCGFYVSKADGALKTKPAR